MTDFTAELNKLVEQGLTVGDCLRFFGERQEKLEPHLQVYIDAVESCDELELDDYPVVSADSEPGAFVLCWKWVTDEQAGVQDLSRPFDCYADAVHAYKAMEEEES